MLRKFRETIVTRFGELLSIAFVILIGTVSVTGAAINAAGVDSALPSVDLTLPAVLDLSPEQIARPHLIAPNIAPDSSARDALKMLGAQHRCLAEMMYYEARSEGEVGERAVAEVVLNRLAGGEHGKSICAVVYEGAGQTFCQFTFVCDGSLNQGKEPEAWRQAQVLAARMLSGEIPEGAETGDATYYHTDAVHPTWAPHMQRVIQIGRHIFYRSAEKPALLAAAFRGSLQQ